MTSDFGYLVCTTPRSGSTFFTKMLTATGVAGRVQTPFHDQSLGRWQEAHGLPVTPVGARADARPVFGAIRQAATGANGVFGLRIQDHSLPYLQTLLLDIVAEAQSPFDALQTLLGPLKVIHLTRTDKVAQAVSYVRAVQSGLWHRHPDGSELERLGPPGTPHFDSEAIAQSIARSEIGDRQWVTRFEQWGITPYRVIYEDLSARPNETVAATLGFLGLDCSAVHPISAPTRRLSDDLNTQWIAQYQALDQATGQINA